MTKFTPLVILSFLTIMWYGIYSHYKTTQPKFKIGNCICRDGEFNDEKLCFVVTEVGKTKYKYFWYDAATNLGLKDLHTSEFTEMNQNYKQVSCPFDKEGKPAIKLAAPNDFDSIHKLWEIETELTNRIYK
jgi:hypothetical protein